MTKPKRTRGKRGHSSAYSRLPCPPLYLPIPKSADGVDLRHSRCTNFMYHKDLMPQLLWRESYFSPESYSNRKDLNGLQPRQGPLTRGFETVGWVGGGHPQYNL